VGEGVAACMRAAQPFLVWVGRGSFRCCWMRASVRVAISCSRTSQYMRWQSAISCAYSGCCARDSRLCSRPARRVCEIFGSNPGTAISIHHTDFFENRVLPHRLF